MKYRLVFFALFFSIISFFSTTRAHTMPNSTVSLHILEDEVRADLVLPIDRLEIAFDRSLATDELIEQQEQELKAYLLSHVAVSSPSGEAWQVEIEDFSVQENDSQRDLNVSVHLQPPSGQSTRQFILRDEIIIKELVTHSILVSIQSDWNNAIFEENPLLVGTIQMDQREVVIDQSGGTWLAGLWGVMKMGMVHISEGFDHLLFLFTLLLPSYLVKKEGKWQFKGSILQVVRIVTAFTIGHSITLLLATLGWIQINTQLVETLVALSIVISSIHVLFPIFPKREPLIAGCFGLIHGMAFSNTLIELGLAGKELFLSILGFNIGIEAMQLFIVCLTIPWLLVLSMRSSYVYIKNIGAIFAGIFAAGWCVARIVGYDNVISAFADTFAQYAYVIPLLLVLLTLLSRVKGMSVAKA